MKKNSNEKIMMLQYRIKRYHAMGNGTMCQTLNGQLQKLLSKQTAISNYCIQISFQIINSHSAGQSFPYIYK